MIGIEKIPDLMRESDLSSWCIRDLANSRLAQHVEKGGTTEMGIEAFEKAWPSFADYGNVIVIATPDSNIGKGNHGVEWTNNFSGGSRWKVRLNGSPALSGGSSHNGSVPVAVMDAKLQMQKLEFQMEELKKAKSSNSLIPPEYQKPVIEALLGLLKGDGAVSPVTPAGTLGNIELNRQDAISDEDLNELEQAVARLLKVVDEKKVIKLINALADSPDKADILISMI